MAEIEKAAVTMEELEAMDAVAFWEEEAGETRELMITDDGFADWAVRKIAAERAELARIRALAEEQISRIEEKLAAAERRCENGTNFLTAKLAEYFGTVPHKATKTQETYRLLSGTLKMKLGSVSMKQDDAKLVEYLKASGQTDFIKITESPKWGDFKKNLKVVGGQVVDTTSGEIVEGVRLEEKPPVFTVEV